ncbi:MAG TPA: pyridoxamine 5'-phosphate oxidase family protein [Thermoanaerobaculia bacterium]
MFAERLRRSLAEGTSVLVGTVDADGVPACCRGVALIPKDDDTVTVYLPVATAQETVANVATTRRLAVCISHPIDHTTTQLKGVTRGVRIAGEHERELVTRSLEKFADILDEIGLPRRITRSVTHWPAFAIDMSVEETFDQTPGPKAGNPIA